MGGRVRATSVGLGGEELLTGALLRSLARASFLPATTSRQGATGTRPADRDRRPDRCGRPPCDSSSKPRPRRALRRRGRRPLHRGPHLPQRLGDHGRGLRRPRGSPPGSGAAGRMFPVSPRLTARLARSQSRCACSVGAAPTTATTTAKSENNRAASESHPSNLLVAGARPALREPLAWT